MKANDLVPEDFDYKEYILNNGLLQALGISSIPENLSNSNNFDINFTVDPSNKIPLPPEFDDLCRLHYIICNRKVTTILEFGVGKSTSIFGNALLTNKNKYFEFTSINLRRDNLYQCHSVDNYKSWLDECKKLISDRLLDEKFINLHLAKLSMSEFSGRVCTYYDPIPNICPDLIYLDGPDQFSPIGDIRGLTTKHKDRMPMSADILSFEHFLQPGTLIIIDGRTANARFLLANLQRRWDYFYSKKWDQHFFELQEEPLGKYNKAMIDHCLGENYYERLKRN